MRNLLIKLKLFLQKVKELIPLSIFIFIVALNFTIVAGYDYAYYDKIAQYKVPPLISLLYDSDNKTFTNNLNCSYLLEFILVISLIILLTVPRSLSPIHIIFPGVVVTLGFWAYDVEIQAHFRIPTINSLKLLLTFKEFMGAKAIFLGIGTILLLLLSIYYILKGFWHSIKGILFCKKLFVKIQLLTILIFKISALVIIITPFTFLNKFYKSTWWNEKEEVWTNGRLSAFYKNSLREIQADLKLDEFQYTLANPPHVILFPDTIHNHPNIYFILLESHVDLSRLKNFSFSKYPTHHQLLKFMPDSTFSLVRSPVIGGYTAQATFEILTGTPALSEMSPIEFLVFGKHPTSSLLQRLKEHGYQTFALIGHSKIFFNMPVAYRDLGFDSSIFLGSISPYKEYYTDRNLFVPDEDTYIYFLKNLPNFPEPRFVYIVTTYGHWPWFMPLDSDTISISPPIKPFPAMANVMYRKQKLLAQLIDTIIKVDSHALIVAFTDHNPPFIFSDTSQVKYDAPSIYHVPILILYKGKKINIPIVPMHRVPELVYHLIAHDTLPDTSNLVPLEIKKYLYKQIIKQSREKL